MMADVAVVNASNGTDTLTIEEGSECSAVSVWQLADSAFPAGSLAHSNGLEAGLQSGRVSGASGLYKFAQESLHALACNSLPLVSSARVADSVQKFLLVDATCEALLASNHVSKRASLAQGKGFMNAAAAAFPFLDLRTLKKTLESSGTFIGHLAPTFGLVCRRLGLKDQDCRRLYLFMALRSQISAAVRLGICGPMEGQALQCKLALETIEPLAAQGSLFNDPRASTIVHTAPITELLQATQDRLYSRLFNS